MPKRLAKILLVASLSAFALNVWLNPQFVPALLFGVLLGGLGILVGAILGGAKILHRRRSDPSVSLIER
jgi:hypothetical protein